MGLVEHAALVQGLFQEWCEIGALRRRTRHQRLAAVERCRGCLAAVLVNAAEQIGNEPTGLAEAGGDGIRNFPGVDRSGTIGDESQRHMAVTLDDLQLQAVARLGGKGQGKGDFALGDYGAITAIGQQRLYLGEQALAGLQIAQNIGNALGRGQRLVL